jgi:hypothetical protein
MIEPWLCCFIVASNIGKRDLTPDRLARYLSGLSGAQNPPRLQR